MNPTKPGHPKKVVSSTLQVEIEMDEDCLYEIIDTQQIKCWINQVWQSVDLLIYPINKFDITHIQQISIYFCCEEKIKQLNHQFRNKNTVTNVLSFPSFDFALENAHPHSMQVAINCLGDLVFCPKVIFAEAESKYKKEKQTHLAHLLVHGFLHLCGLEHSKEKNAKQMEKEEIKILKKLGFKNPYLY